MKKNIQLLVLGALLGLLLTSCKPETFKPQGTVTATPKVNLTLQAQVTPSATKLPEINMDPKQLDGIQITYLHPWAGESGRMMDLLVEEFNQSNEWGINVLIQQPGSTGLAIQTLRESESGGINIAALPTYELLYQDQNQNEVLDLNPYAASAKVGFSKEERADFHPVFWDQSLVDGKLYGIPAEEAAAVLFYNATWANELGFSSAPKTAQAFKLQTCAANANLRTDNEYLNDGQGGWMINSDADSLLSWLNALDAIDLAVPVEKFNTTKVRESFQFLFTLQKEDCAWPNRLPDPYDYFATRQAIVYSGTTQDILPQSEAFARSGLQDEWQVIAYPGGENTNFLTNGLTYGVFKSDAQKELASWLFIRWISQPVNQARLLQTSGSLPLGSSVLEYMTSFENENPRWKDALDLLPDLQSKSVQPTDGIIRMVLADAGTFIFRPELTGEELPGILSQMDQTIKELSSRKP